jgi:hypothetical protein
VDTVVRQMRKLNPRALVTREHDYVVVVEDHSDPDGRPYRLEYRVTPDCSRAIAYCLYNPWGDEGDPSAGEDYFVAHVDSDGFLCLGHGSERQLGRSPFGLDYAVRRARFWCTGFSVFQETGTFPNP